MTEDAPPEQLQATEGERHLLRQTVPTAPQDDGVLQSERQLAGRTELY